MIESRSKVQRATAKILKYLRKNSIRESELNFSIKPQDRKRRMEFNEKDLYTPDFAMNRDNCPRILGQSLGQFLSAEANNRNDSEAKHIERNGPIEEITGDTHDSSSKRLKFEGKTTLLQDM